MSVVLFLVSHIELPLLFYPPASEPISSAQTVLLLHRRGIREERPPPNPHLYKTHH